MKKQELLKIIDKELLDNLYGFCYGRTSDSREAQELCSDIVFELVKTANTVGEIGEVYPFLWRVARNVYADFCRQKSRRAEILYQGDSEEALALIAAKQEDDDSKELLKAVYRRIAFLTRAYREVMILFYLDGLSTAKIATLQGISETAVRQRLFSARKKLQREVKDMTDTTTKPMALNKVNFVIWGTGDPAWSDPRKVCTRQFSKQILRLCQKKPQNAAEIAEELNVPTVYVEEELDILARGTNGKYGLLRELNNGKYAVNFVLLDTPEFERAISVYEEQIPALCDTIAAHIEKYREEYLAFPYLNKKVDFNLILWQQLYALADDFFFRVEEILAQKYFAETAKSSRPFSVFGYLDNGRRFGGGHDGIQAQNICGYGEIHVQNIYMKYIRKHFDCGRNLATDPQLQLAIRAIAGLKVSALSEFEKEHAAKAVECGYLYREGDTLYTKILVSDKKDEDRLYSVSYQLSGGDYEANAELTAGRIADLTRKVLPDYLLSEWRFVNALARLPLIDSVADYLINKGILTPPEDGVGAEGCWMSVRK